MAEAKFATSQEDKIAIVPYHDDFRFQVVGLWGQVFENVSLNIIDRDIEVASQREPSLFYLATENDRLLGTCIGACDGHRSWIYYLCVVPGRRRNGIASRLLKHVESLLREEGCQQVGLHTRRRNFQALDFYKKSGYFIEEAVSLGKYLKD